MSEAADGRTPDDAAAPAGLSPEHAGESGPSPEQPSEHAGPSPEHATAQAAPAAAEAAGPRGRLPAARPEPAGPPSRVCGRCRRAPSAVAHFCESCGAFLEAPDVGTLATARRRLGAAFLDSAFQGGGPLVSLLPLLAPRSPAVMGLVGLISTGYWLFSAYLWSKGTTPAKRALEMRVVTADGEPAGFVRMALRETVGKGISTAVLGLGLLAIPSDRERQGWHDKIFGTFVVREDDD